MPTSNRLSRLLLALLVAGFFSGITWLYLERFDSGDVYSPYSTLRADPLGAKAFFEALSEMPDLRVQRNLGPLGQVAPNRAATLFLLGVSIDDPDVMPMEFARDLDRILGSGGRVVVAFAPTGRDVRGDVAASRAMMRRMDERFGRGEPQDEQKDDGEESGDSGKKQEENDENDEERSRRPFSEIYGRIGSTVKVEERWGVRLEFEALTVADDARYLPETARLVTNAELPSTIPVHSSLYFDTKAPDWEVVYTRKRMPVMIERRFDEGSLVLVSDPYLLSNEALRVERHAELLAWLVGRNREVVFDETHLGVRENPGIAALIRKYNLHGAVFTLLVLAALYIWKNAQPLVPPYPDDLPVDAGRYYGKDSASGFANLMRRSVPPRELVRTCVNEWQKSFSHRLQDFERPLREVRSILHVESAQPRKEWDPVRAYRQICVALSRGRGPGVGFRVPGSRNGEGRRGRV